MLPELVTKKDLCKLFGLSSRRIEQLAQDGIINGTGNPAKYNLVEAVQGYAESLKASARKRQARR